MTKLRKTSKTKLQEENTHLGSGETIIQPDVNENKAKSIKEARKIARDENRVISPEDQKIRQAFVDKDWNEIKIADSWQIFKVRSEFVEGFEKLAKIGPCV